MSLLPYSWTTGKVSQFSKVVKKWNAIIAIFLYESILNLKSCGKTGCHYWHVLEVTWKHLEFFKLWKKRCHYCHILGLTWKHLEFKKLWKNMTPLLPYSWTNMKNHLKFKKLWKNKMPLLPYSLTNFATLLIWSMHFHLHLMMV